jgi:hypothetical protein
MKRSAFLTLTILLLLASFSLAGPQTNRSAQAAASPAVQHFLQNAPRTAMPDACPVTQPPARRFVPPSPYPTQIDDGSFWFGTEKLWTFLGKDGTWKGLSHYKPTDTSFRQKLFWFREGWLLEAQPKLEVTGKRLDATAPPLEANTSNGWTDDRLHPFMVTGIDMPTIGCWKITARYEDAELSFVVWVTQ